MRVKIIRREGEIRAAAFNTKIQISGTESKQAQPSHYKQNIWSTPLMYLKSRTTRNSHKSFEGICEVFPPQLSCLYIALPCKSTGDVSAKNPRNKVCVRDNQELASGQGRDSNSPY